MQPVTQSFWILRIFCPGMDGDLYVYNATPHAYRSSWALTSKFRNAKHFYNRSDARRAARSKTIQAHLDDGDWFWEVAKVTATTTYEAEVVCGDAPAMVQIARSVM
jgi:hypothetical protein